jgi:uncharacterized protein (TIGR02246 family)
LVAVPLAAQEKAALPEDPAHAQLRALKKDVEDAFNKRDIEKLISYMTPDVVVTWQNGDVSRKHEGMRAYYQKMLLDKNAVVESLSVKPEVDELSILYNGDTAIAFGTLGDHYKLRDGMEFNLNSRWNATAVKQGDRWLLASAHLSTNAFDNEVLHAAVKRTAIWVGGGGLAVGLLFGFVATRAFSRRRSEPENPAP